MKLYTSKEQTAKLIMLGLEKPKSEWKDIVGYEGLYQISSNAELKEFNEFLKHTNVQSDRPYTPRQIKDVP